MGSDYNLYAENGRFAYTESPKDLIEEVTSTRHTFSIPDGVKEITLDYFGNRIVVEMVPEEVEPKPGDVLVNTNGSVYIFKEAISRNKHKHFAWLGRSGRLVYNDVAISGRPATPEEAQPLFDALRKAGKKWNAETMQIEEIPEIERILEWVEEHLNDGYYNQQGIAEVVGHYLNHKEDKK